MKYLSTIILRALGHCRLGYVNIIMASTSEDSSGQESNKKTSVNSFANDGSFFEMYKQKLKETENTKDEKKEENSDEEKRKTTNLLLQGKRKIPVGRMGGASKQLDAKKKKQEKEKTKKLTENPDEKSPAWKAYMEEVQKYKEMSCTDDSDHIRPLVK